MAHRQNSCPASRREFITLLGGTAAAWPLAARAQQDGRMRRVGVIMSVAENDSEFQARSAALVRGLRELGWVDGRNIRIDVRGLPTGDTDRIRGLVAELVASKPDVLQATPTPIVQELQRQTSSIPIVFVATNDPVESGIVPSLARPGGNTTGFMNFEPSMAGKWLQLLKEVAPSVRHAAVIGDPRNPTHASLLRAVGAAAQSFGMQVSEAAVRDGNEIENAMATLASEPNCGVIVTAGPLINDRRRLIFALAARYRLPAVYGFRYFALDGGLMSYGPDNQDMWHRSATYIDRILRGEKPGDLPVQAPVKYELVVNVNAAKAIGLTIPETFLVRADEVIE